MRKLVGACWNWLMSHAAWEIVAYTSNIEIEVNTVTGEHRYRHLLWEGGELRRGRWFAGLPHERFTPMDLDDPQSPAEMALRLAPHPFAPPSNDRF